MTQPPSPNTSAEVQQSFADLFALEEHARGLIVIPLHRWGLNPIIQFASYRKWMLVFYGLADPFSFMLSKAFTLNSMAKKEMDAQSRLKELGVLFITFIAYLFGIIISSAVVDIAGNQIYTYTGVTPTGDETLPMWIFWPSVLILLVWAGAQMLNWGRFVLNKKYLALRMLVFAVFLLVVSLLPRLDEDYLWMMRVFTPDILVQYRLNYFFLILLIFAALSFWFWFVVKIAIWGVVLAFYLLDIITHLTKPTALEDVQDLLQPISLGEGRAISLGSLLPSQLRSAQEWTKNRIEAINYRFVSISAFLALFTVFTTSSTAQGWVDQVVKLLLNMYVQHEGLGYGETLLGFTLTAVIIGFVALFYNYWRGIVALNLIREACILIQYNNPPVPQPQPPPAAGGTPHPWYKVSLIFLLTSLVFLFTSIIKDRRSK